MNMNELAKQITVEEVAAKELSIAKVKKILKMVGKKMNEDSKVIEGLLRIGRGK